MGGIESALGNLMSIWTLFGIFAVLLLLSSLGALAGLINRNLMILAVICLVALSVVVFHHHLPLPLEWHLELEALRKRIM